ncbi:uncharacterized protein [Ptychodera flava]|uniref:uncharacterized protein n=1 Tax=Ptychodera flava TaxID=63121 RepID=UPI00396A15B6
MSDREVIIEIFEELKLAQFKRAKSYLKDYDVPGGIVEQVKDADDMADLTMRYFESSKRKEIIRDILKKTKCEDVIEKFKKYLPDPQERGPILGRHKIIYNDLNNKLGVEEEDKLRNLLEGNQLEKRELQELKNVAGILNKLDEKGYFDDGFELLKELLKQIQRKPLIKLVETCEQGKPQ